MFIRFCIVGVFLSSFSSLTADDGGQTPSLTFDRQRINRYSLDHLPRSLSIRQGNEVWFGYDLERAKLYKIWKARDGEPGLVVSGFTTKSKGTTWYEDTSEEGWTFSFDGASIPMAVRYQGCTQRSDHFELRWELKHRDRRWALNEQIPFQVAGESRAQCRVKVDLMNQGDIILPPSTMSKAWVLLDEQGVRSNGLSKSAWYRWDLR